jgi:hypothetical protein
MPNFINLPPLTEDGDVHVLVETPRGSRAKFAYEPKLETFVLSKSLLTGLTYPHDWGFVPYFWVFPGPRCCCPSSNAFGQSEQCWNGGSGSFWVGV